MHLSTPPILTPAIAKSLLDGANSVSTDLGITQIKVTHTEEGICFDDLSVKSIDLRKIAKRENSAYFVSKYGVFQVAISEEHFYKLVPTDGAPTLEIDGIRMHRTKDTTPEKDTHAKLDSLGMDHGTVFDTCMGLGYSAIEAEKRGSSLVVTVELHPNVVRIAQMNPWSRGLFEGSVIHKIMGDTYFVVDSFPCELFNYVIHDPPRHRDAGNLYSLVFYSKLFRVMRVGGRMFHYTGEPRSRYRGVNFRKGVSERLKEAGFTDIVYHTSCMGFTCTKRSV
jgi:predicted methyltransferase